jgi:uncharacterized protein DUF4242
MECVMPRFLIERNFAEALEVTNEGVDQVRQINDEEGVRWLFSFLSPDKRKTYCLYEANAEAIRIAARRANIPADVFIEVSELRPEMFAGPSVGATRLPIGGNEIRTAGPHSSWRVPSRSLNPSLGPSSHARIERFAHQGT